MIVSIALDVPLYQVFSYTHEVSLPVGSRVLVEFRNRQVIGFVWYSPPVTSDAPLKLKPILKVLPETLPHQVIELAKFCAVYYHYPIGVTIFSIIPQVIRKNKAYNSKNISLVKKLTNKNPENQQNIALNREQLEAVDSIIQTFNTFVPHLLYGVTGSGKTEVYLSLIEQMLDRKKQVLVLVPEINLTPQMLGRFATRFASDKMVVLTSNANANKRYQGYLAANNGDCQIVIGTRLSIFTPFDNLGLIIVDEEHDQSFKQNDTLRYQARDLAVWRAQKLNIPVVLGSATPSLETLYKYKTGHYKLHKLVTRAVTNATLPKIKIIDINKIENVDGFAPPVLKLINDRLNKNELSLIFINRRGYSPVISCHECGHVMNCRRCSTTLVYHSATKNLKCHHCGYTIGVPSSCIKCNSQYLQAIGDGTQKIEESLSRHFPKAKIGRIDQDTTSSKYAWDELYARINNNELDILVGTQMLAKGHDFHNLTLVVGLNIDYGLYSYDFRASELLFTQLTQISGRAGRGSKSGVVLLQTRYPDHELYQYLQNHDFAGFIDYLFKFRKQLMLPPYTHYALFRASGKSIVQVLDYLRAVASLMEKLAIANVFINEPVPSIMQRLKNKERGQILLQSNNRHELNLFFERLIPLLKAMKPKHSISFSIDIDPYDM